MRFLNVCKLYIYILLLVFAGACSTTKVIPQGESRLKANKIVIENSETYPASDLQPYIKQKPNTYFVFGWNPFLNIYNWSNGKNNGWNRFVKKLGQAPVIFDPNLVESSKRNMDNHLVYLGYYNSTITDTVVTKKKKTTVTYRIRLGKQYYIDQVEYIIRDSALRTKFYVDTARSMIKKGNLLSEKMLEDESQRIAKIFRDQGYYGFTKNYFFFEADTLKQNDSAKLQVRIEDYTRNEYSKDGKPHRVFHFGNVYINPIRNYNPFIRAAGRLSDTSDTSAVANSSAGISGQTPMPRPANDTVLFKGINLIYRGKPLLRPNVLAHTNRIKPGSLYDESAVSNTYNRFSNLGLFSSVNIQVNEVDSATVDCSMKLTASDLQGYKINLEVSSNSNGLLGISPKISYFYKNLFRGGELFSISLGGNFQFKFKDKIRSTEFDVSTSLNVPDFLLIPDKLFKNAQQLPHTEISFSYNYQNRPEYTRNIISATYGYTWSRKNRFFYKVNPLQVNIVKLSDISDEFYQSLDNPFLRNSYQNHFDLGLGASLYYTTDASPNPSRSYFYLRWQNDIAGNVLSLFNHLLPENSNGERTIWGSPYSQYYRTEISAVYTWKFGKSNRQALAARLLFGIGSGYGNSLSLPFEKLFWAGGAYSLRGWQARTVGPGNAQLDTTFSIPNQTGDIRLEGNIEYRFPLFWNFDGAVFVDAGNVWNMKQDSGADESKFKFNNFYKQIALDWGAGLRLNLGFVLLRLDMGIKTYDPSDRLWLGPDRWFKKGNYALQFGVGYPF